MCRAGLHTSHIHVGAAHYLSAQPLPLDHFSRGRRACLLGSPAGQALHSRQETTLQVWVNYEDEICIPTHCFYLFTNACSGLISVRVTGNVAPTVTAFDEQYGMRPWDFGTCGHKPAYLSSDPIATFSDLARGDLHTAAINWGDGIVQPGIGAETGGLDMVSGDHWEFGNGTVATDGLTPTHVYNDTKEFTVMLTVTDDGGGVGEDSLNVVAFSEEFRTATATLVPTQMPTLTEPQTATPASGRGCTASTGSRHMVDGSWALLGLVWSGLVLVPLRRWPWRRRSCGPMNR